MWLIKNNNFRTYGGEKNWYMFVLHLTVDNVLNEM